MIREYEEQDADALVSIWRAATAIAHPFLAKDFVDSEAEALRNVYLKFAKTWVTEIDGKIVGFIAMVENEVAGLFLHPSFHGRGLGRDMVVLAVQKQGPLRVEVFEKNIIGRGFYKAFGFRGSEQYVHDATGETVLKLAYMPD
jgi:putative acetyltransferase